MLISEYLETLEKYKKEKYIIKQSIMNQQPWLASLFSSNLLFSVQRHTYLNDFVILKCDSEL